MKEKKYGIFDIIFREFKIAISSNKSLLFFIPMITIFGGILPVVSIFLPRIIIDTINDSNVNLNRAILLIIIICCIGGVSAIINYSFSTIAYSKYLDVRMKEFISLNKSYSKLDYKYLEDPQFKDYFKSVSTCLGGDGLGFQAILTNTTLLLPLIVSLILFVVIIGIFNVYVVLICLFSSFVVCFANAKLGKYIAKKRVEKSHIERQLDYYSNVSYDFSYGKDIRVYSLSHKLNNDYSKRARSQVEVIKDIENKRFSFGLLEIVSLLLEDAFAYFFVIKGYFDGAITFGQVSLYIGAIISLSFTLRRITDIVTELTKSKPYCVEYFKFIDDKKYFTNRGNHPAFSKEIPLEIEFKNVSFKYPNTDRYVIKDFNFKINAKEKLAIVGLNGAGKSTLVKLITGLYQVNEGEILINGINVDDFDKNEIHKLFSIVYQDINIYPCTIIQNIIGDDESKESKERAIECLNMVGLKEKIESLPLGYDTPMLKIVDENGVELSGGQNQKICIARALYKDGNMVILDEPTSALDALAEASIYQSFDELVKNKTAIYISHRLSSTKFCDKIALFSKEGLIEYGSHNELMDKKGEYYKMFLIQGKYYTEGVKEDEK